jgi:hypothetical protein
MYGRPIPVVALSAEDFAALRTGDRLRIDESGTVTAAT